MINTLKNSSDFTKVYKNGMYSVGKYVVLYVFKSNLNNVNRLGIVTSKKVGKSVKRNRIRRLVREIYRTIDLNLIKGFDFVLMARKSDKIPDYYDMKKEIRFLFKKQHLFSEESSQ